VLKVTLLIATLERSGAAKQATLLAQGLQRQETDVEVVALDRGGPLADELETAGFPVTVIRRRGRFDLGAWRRLRRHLATRQPDVIQSWGFAPNAYARIAASPHCSRVIVTERSVDAGRRAWQHWIDRRLAKRTACLVVNARCVAEFYRDAGFPEDRITVIADGVEIPVKREPDRHQRASDVGVPDDARLVVSAGHLAPQQRFESLLWGAQVLRQADPRAYLIIIGDGSDRAKLEQYARDVESAQHVRFLGERDDVPHILSQCDVFWAGSAVEGVSHLLLEAMAAGVPIVASNTASHREFVTHNREGYLVNLDDGVGFAQYTIKLFDNPTLRQQLGDAGRERMMREFTVEQMVQRHLELYHQLVER